MGSPQWDVIVWSSTKLNTERYLLHSLLMGVSKFRKKSRRKCTAEVTLWQLKYLARWLAAAHIYMGRDRSSETAICFCQQE